MRILREKSGLTQAQLGEQLGFSNQRYNYYETGKREPDNATLIKIAEYFNVSTDYLLGATDDPTPTDKKKAPPTFEEVERAYLQMLLEEKGTSIEDLVLSEEDMNELRGALRAMIKGYKK